GSITLNVIGATPPLYISTDNGSSYNLWTNGTPITGLLQGTYTIYVVDANSCQSSDVITLIYNDCSATLDTIGTCSPLTMSAQTTNILSGAYSYTYNLFFEGTLIETISSSLDSIVFTSLVSDSGNYMLEVINDSTGCISSDSIVLNFNTMSVNVLAQNNVTAQGSCDGFISVEVLGGSFPYTITWTDGSGSVINGPTQPFNTSSIASLCEDNYCIEVTDGTPCTITECFDIVFTSCNTILSITDSIDCYNYTGEITATVDTTGGGIGPIITLPGERYTYTLYSLNPTTQIGLPILSDDTSNVFTGLFAGSYLVDVIDNSYGTLCTSDSIVLTQPNPINIYLTTDSTSAPWILDGSIIIDSITGGTLPYSYQWLDSVGISFSTSSDSVTGLGYSNQYNGGFTLIVTDTNGCTQQQTVYIHPNNAGANLAVDSVGVQDASCFGLCDGKLYMLPLNVGPGSVAPFIYTWRDAITGIIMRVDSNGSSQYNGAPSHVATYTNRCAGFYTLEIEDAYGNTLPPIDFTIEQPDSMYVDLGPDIVIDCGEDTVLTAVPVGGNQTNDTTLVNSFILDFNNQNGIGDTLITGGLYYLEVSGTLTDGFGNNYDAAYDYTAFPQLEVMLWNFDGTNTHRPSPNIYDPSHTYVFPFIAGSNGGIPGMGVHTWSVPPSNYIGQLSCNLYVVDTGVYNYNYTWTSNPLSFPMIISDEDTCYMNPGLTLTDYIVNVVDAQGCVAIDTVNVMWDLYILNFQTNTTNVVPCYGDAAGTINVSVDSSYGFNPYTYTVLDMSGATINSVSAVDTTFNLLAGDYITYIQDNIGCLSENDTITITEPDSIWACGIGNLNTQFLIDNFVMDFDTISTAFTHSTPVSTLLGVNYLLVVNGTYGLEFFNPNHKDPAFIIASGIATDDWSVNGFPVRPDLDVYNNSHQYSYTISGDGNPMLFSFIDPTGSYNDNAGSLSFTLYKLGCANTDTVYTCSGDSTGYSSISATGGVPFDPDGIANSGDEYYNFTWADASSNNWTNYSVTNGVTSSISGLPFGLYTVTIEDANGCNNYERYLRVLESTDSLVIDSAEVLDVLCFGAETAEVTAYFSGGFGPYLTVLTHVNGSSIDTIYESINDIDSVSIDSLTYGSYTLYVYDSLPDNLNGTYFCPQIFNFNITQPQSHLTSTVNLLSHVSCWGDSTGKAKVIAYGGNSLHPYTYLWDNGETTAIADSLWADVNLSWPSPQWQGITITDFNGCSIRDSIQIEHLNEEIQAYNTLDGSNTVQVIQNVQCFNACDAIVTVSSVGGVLPHSYSWDIGNVGNFMPDTTNGVCYGGHDIIIEDQVGCRKTVYYQISQPDELFADAHWVDHIDCYGYDNGIAHAFATGGTTPYTFVWDSLTGQQNDTAYNLTPGIHTVYVTDDKGCMASDTVTITEPTELTIAIQDTSTVYSYCTGTNSATLYAIAQGGIEPYNYVWSDVLGQTTQWADDLIAGIYTVTVLDDRGCSASDTRNIDSVTNSMDATTSVTDVSCFGLFDGSTFVDNVMGAVPINSNPLNDPVNPPYTFSWTGPNGYTANQNQINYLYAGNYGVTITDSNNCSITIYTDVQEPNQLEYTLYDITGSTCYGSCNGSISVDVEGGTSPYSYDFDEIGTFPFLNPVPLINDSLILDLCAGDYDIYVTDENDCIGTVLWGGIWQATIDSGVVVSVSAPNVTQSASCYNTNDGHANVFWWDVNPLFTYTWETLSGTIIDTGTHTTILSGGDYNLVAHYSDSANFGQVYTACDASVQFNMPSPSQILANESVVTIACYGDANGSISLFPSGGSGSNYTYQWDTTTSVPNGSTNSSINGLQEATYTVTITDGDGCTETIDYPLIEPDPLTNNFNPIVNASCNGDNDGSIKANISGGTPIYSYSWSPSGGNNQTANSLTAGNYTVTVTDSRSCTESFDITITEPDAIISGVEPNAFYGNDATGTISYNISCNGLSDGSAIVNLGGGTAPYNFSWTSGGSNQLETGMPAGTHTVTVTDNQGCYEDMDITLVEPDLLVVNGTSTGNYTPFPGGFDISCKGLNDGECYADPTGGVPGTPGYMYSWSGPIGGQISNLDEITNLYVGTYSVTVTDANGCSSSETFVLTEPTEEFISETHLVNYAGAAVSPVTAAFQDNTISVDQYDYTFYWPTGDSSEVINVTNGDLFPDHSFTEIGENEVYIKVQNMNSGCIDDTTFIIEVQGIPEIHNVFTPNGDGTNDYFDFEEFAMKDIDVSIYNRWGEMVTNWQDSNHQWDGRGVDGEDLPEGVYYYVLIATGEDGHAYQKKGSITLLR
ncbi:gliding motility-associated C-terminal domain-containing protein, partial [Flavobacteriales bacterium]|nr:gliding motility-associated C-terminal domain-containing protein [Flavobacteriales bacterium]